jgi:hypothetical protein
MIAPGRFGDDGASWPVMKIRLSDKGRPGFVGTGRAARPMTEQGDGLGGS